jgi:peptidoglycan/LPS O-acetylase OafA/YrhL
MNRQAEGRLMYLEAARGLASIIVINHHLLIAFAPHLRKPFPRGVMFTPLFPFMNGDGAVQFFFVLSGFVLSLALMRQPLLSTMIVNCVKRIPRLIVPVGISILAGYFILKAGLIYNIEAAELSGSEWLRSFGNAQFPQHFRISFEDALRQSLFVFLVPGDFYYNSNLWTMRLEFYGSLIVFCGAYLTGRFVTPQNEWIAILVFLAATALLTLVDAPMIGFMLGALVAYIFLNKTIILWREVRIGLFLFGCALLVFQNTYITAVGSSLLLFVLSQSRWAERALSTDFGRQLGKLSFPIYLVHTLVICSVGTLAYIRATEAGYSQVTVFIIAAAVSILVTVVAAIPFVYIEAWWVKTLNSFVKQLAARLGIPPPTQKHSAKSL